MEDGRIKPDSEFGKELGFTSDLFRGWLWKTGDQVTISFIESLHPGQGNLSRLIDSIEAAGFAVEVPSPLDKMARILRRKGFVPHIEIPDMGGIGIDVWQRKGGGRMKAADTVLDIVELRERMIAHCAEKWGEAIAKEVIEQTTFEFSHKIVQAQAEATWAIAFQAGYEQAQKEALKEWRLEFESGFYGINKFVDWSPEGLREFRKRVTKHIMEAFGELVEET